MVGRRCILADPFIGFSCRAAAFEGYHIPNAPTMTPTGGRRAGGPTNTTAARRSRLTGPASRSRREQPPSSICKSGGRPRRSVFPASPAKQPGFKPSAPIAKGSAALAEWGSSPRWQEAVSKLQSVRTEDRGFESISLQQGVTCEPDVRPSILGSDKSLLLSGGSPPKLQQLEPASDSGPEVGPAQLVRRGIAPDM